MPITRVTQWGGTITEPTPLEDAEYRMNDAKEKMNKFPNVDIPDCMANIKLAVERLRVLETTPQEHTQKPDEELRERIQNEVCRGYNESCFTFDKMYSEWDWQGPQKERDFLVAQLTDHRSDKIETALMYLGYAEDWYKRAEKAYNEMSGKSQDEINRMEASHSVTSETRLAGEKQIAEITKYAKDLNEVDKKRKQKEEEEAQIEAGRQKVELQRRFWDKENQDPIPREDQEKYDKIRERASALVAEYQKAGDDVMGAGMVKYRVQRMREWIMRMRHESNPAEFLQDNKDQIRQDYDLSDTDLTDAVAQGPQAFMEKKFKDSVARFSAGQQRRKQMLDQCREIESSAWQELSSYDVDLGKTVDGYGEMDRRLSDN